MRRLLVAFVALNAWAELVCGIANYWKVGEGREIIELEHNPEGVVWVVQLSDLHISAYDAQRANSLKTHLPPLLHLINPALVLITGDLTDAKYVDPSKVRGGGGGETEWTQMREDETEWRLYKDAMETVVRESGLPQYAFFDMRGNHDNFGVPNFGGPLDYFSKYSLSALLNRTSSVQSVTIQSNGWKHLFVGIDSSMEVGLRGPCNLIGHPTDDQLQKLDVELSQWDNSHPNSNTKIVFGHFPLSFTASTNTGKRPEGIFAKHSISAYLCGHLHTKFGNNLVKHHMHYPYGTLSVNSCTNAGSQHGQCTECGEFWEWEIGDWRKSRILRVIAVDAGHTSFLDVDLSSPDFSSHDAVTDLPTIILVTYPLDAETMQRVIEPKSLCKRDSIRALVFSPIPVTSVIAKIFNCSTKPSTLKEAIRMESMSRSDEKSLLFSAAWNASKYVDTTSECFLLQVEVIDLRGKHTHSKLRTFSSTGKLGQQKWTWGRFLVMGIVYDNVYPFLTLTAFVCLFCLLVPPKIFLLLCHGYHKKLAISIFEGYSRKRIDMTQILMSIWWALVQTCEDHILWWSQLLLLVYLLFFPWFWGVVLHEDYPAGSLSPKGWSVKIKGEYQSGLGVPDVMIVVLPYLYQVVLPFSLLISALSAERSFLELHILFSKRQHYSAMDEVTAASESSNFRVLNSNFVENRHESNCKLCRRWIRPVLYAGCVAITAIHIRQIEALLRAYGVKTVLISPGFAWPMLLFWTLAIWQTSRVRKLIPPSHQK